MREILFKAKRTDNGEWVEGYVVKLGSVYWIYTGKINKIDSHNGGSTICNPASYIVDPETLCQYTGLTDKNGKKIWENDIVKVRHEKYSETPDTEFDLFPTATVYTRNYAVEFINTGSNYGYRCRNRSIHFLITKNTIYNHDVEVIGNIFDNPELLEGGAE